jgi:nicotinate-nucleotide adenylyltransferase
MGGTFDPIHHGHLVAASEVQSYFDLDEVIFVPTGQPWQKLDRAVSPPEDRYLMTVIATASNPRFSVSRVDIDRPELFFITGADALAQILTWRDVDEMFKLAQFVGCTRPGYESQELPLDRLPMDRITLLEVPALAISSTECRKRVAKGNPTWYLVPDGIVQYIAKRDLYTNH